MCRSPRPWTQRVNETCHYNSTKTERKLHLVWPNRLGEILLYLGVCPVFEEWRIISRMTKAKQF